MGWSRIGYTESIHYRCLEDLEEIHSMKTINPLFLAYSGKEDCVPGWQFGPYSRHNYLIHIIKSGKGTFHVGSKVYELSAGEAFFIYPGIETTYRADDEDPWSYMWMGFNGYNAEVMADEMGFTRENPVIRLRDTEPISSGIDRILDARELTFANFMRRKAAFYDTLAAVMELNVGEISGHDFTKIKYVEQAVELITASFNKKVRISEIADSIGINRSYLTSVFKKEMNMSPQAFLINYRLEKAASMIRGTEESISNIAEAVGYTDSLTFSKAFKQKYGESPSAFRKKSSELVVHAEKGEYEGRYHL